MTSNDWPEQGIGESAAIVCEHVALNHAPILVAIRDEPVDAADSGWQFSCGRYESEPNVKIWAVSEVVDEDPSLRPHIGAPAGTVLTRKSANATWRVSREVDSTM